MNCKNCNEELFDNGTVYVHRRRISSTMTLETQECASLKRAEPLSALILEMQSGMKDVTVRARGGMWFSCAQVDELLREIGHSALPEPNPSDPPRPSQPSDATDGQMAPRDSSPSGK